MHWRRPNGRQAISCAVAPWWPRADSQIELQLEELAEQMEDAAIALEDAPDLSDLEMRLHDSGA